jgi:hypothetical protein
MLLFIVIATIVFLFASKHYFIGKKHSSGFAHDGESLTRFAFLMLICSLLWLAVKFAMRFSGGVLIALMVGFVLKELAKKSEKAAVSAKQ